ncbi:MAG: hypothetical protein WBF89_19885 [Steroidobacteraceae bacterium]|jgi:hypothetical protein
MLRLIVAVVVVWLVLMPPFFTRGACTAEFDSVARQIEDHKPALAESASAQAYWTSVHVPVQVISAAGCAASKPRFIDRCGPGDLLYIAVPIQNKVCSFYRDSEVRIQLQYDDRGRLRQLQADMKPYKYFSLPWLGLKMYWGR